MADPVAITELAMQGPGHFDWPQVAGIAGGVSIVLMGLIGVLLTIILKRQGGLKQPDIISFFSILDGKLTAERADYEEKLQSERTERIEIVKGIYDRVEEVRADQKEDVTMVVRKMDSSQTFIIDQFREICSTRQEGCAGMMKGELRNQSNRLKTACEKIQGLKDDLNGRATRFEAEQSQKWTQQGTINARVLKLNGKEVN